MGKSRGQLVYTDGYNQVNIYPTAYPPCRTFCRQLDASWWTTTPAADSYPNNDTHSVIHILATSTTSKYLPVTPLSPPAITTTTIFYIIRKKDL